MISSIVLLVLVILTCLIIALIFRTVAKIAIILMIVYALFHVGFIWGYDEISQKFHIDQLLKPEVNQAIKDESKVLESKRASHAVIDSKKMEGIVENELAKALANSQNAYEGIDKKALYTNVKNRLNGYSDKTINQALNDLDQYIQSKLAEQQST